MYTPNNPDPKEFTSDEINNNSVILNEIDWTNDGEGVEDSSLFDDDFDFTPNEEI